ncbi:MAG: helix-hairpin-helix domain-containing protein [Bacteroidia bacterium]|nr:helix-hairpin-helix domain-containing protein [Bacteroidia bacterium]
MRWGTYLFCVSILSAQILPDTLEAGQWELQLEDQAESAPESIDWTQLSDIYEELIRHPVDLNRASDETLLRLPGMTPQLLRALRRHQALHGPLLSIYELQAVSGFNERVFRTLRPYVVVRPATELDIGDGLTRPPTLSQIKAASRFTCIQRIQRSWQAVHNDTVWQEEPLLRALGSPYRLYTRVWFQAAPYLSAAIIGEKDAYEPLYWRPSQRYYGYDFLSGHIAISQIGRLRRLVIGDYILQTGQGLVFARGLGFGKGGDPILTLKQPAYGLLPYTSVNEYQFWRGAAAAWRFSNHWTVTGMVARMHQDGTLHTSSGDSLEEHEIFVRTLLTSGLHRTPSELARRGKLQHDALGGILTWQKKWHTLGGTLLYQSFSPPLNLRGNEPYRFFGFTGKENLLFSAFWDLTVGNINFFGEAARSRSGGQAITASCIAVLHPTLDVALQVRHFDPNFHSLYAYTFAERPFSIQNEQGFYLGIRVRPAPRWEIWGFHDLYRFPWYRYRANSPTEGHESSLQITYTLRRRFQAYFRLRYETKPYNITSDFAQGYIHRLSPHTRMYFRLHGSYEFMPTWRYQARIEVSSYQRETKSLGGLLYQDIRWQPSFDWSISIRWVVYRIQSFDARIYTYEAMPPTTFFIPGYYGNGQRFYLMIRSRMGRHWTIWIRVGQNLFRPPEERAFQRRVEGLLQIRYQL